MTCPARLEPLPCSFSGVGFLANPATPDAATLHLMLGQGDSFPMPSDGKVFYVDVSGCGCCTRLKVTGRTGDNLTVEPGSLCSCLPSGARVSYATSSPEHMRLAAIEAMPTFLPPLIYDCATNTVRLDCDALKDLVASPCE